MKILRDFALFWSGLPDHLRSPSGYPLTWWAVVIACGAAGLIMTLHPVAP